MVFMVLCGVNFNLYYLAFKDGISHLFKDSEFRFYLLIFGVSAILIATVLFVTGKNDSIGGAAVDAAFQTDLKRIFATSQKKILYTYDVRRSLFSFICF